MEKIIGRIDALLVKDFIGNWHRGFLESVKSQAEKRYTLSEKQLKVLDDAEKQYSGNALKKILAWKEKYRNNEEIEIKIGEKYYKANVKDVAELCADYYQRVNYFQDLVFKIKSEKDFIPTEKQFRSMCFNKYALKIIKGCVEEPLFEEGSLVKIRKTWKWKDKIDRWHHELLDNIVMIIEQNAMNPYHACAKNKIYRVVPVDGMQTVLIEERFLKKLR